MGDRKLQLRGGWYTQITAHFDLQAAGIYEWRVEGAGLYVGKAKLLSSRIRAYPNNVRRMIEGLPWHGDSIRDYRRVHRELRRAYDDHLPVTVSILENCDPDARADREQAWIKQRRQEWTQGGLLVWN